MIGEMDDCTRTLMLKSSAFANNPVEQTQITNAAAAAAAAAASSKPRKSFQRT